MSVSLTVSETLDGAEISDSLAGGGTGSDFGQCINGQYTPITSKAGNTGWQDIYISHNAVTDPITSLKAYIQAYGTDTGFTYGGANSAALDYTKLVTIGAASGGSKNNADGLSSGVWMEMQANVSTANAFDQAGRPTYVKIFGDNSTDGIDLASAITISSAAMVYNAAGEQTATTPVAGSVGKAGDTVLGDAAHLRYRLYLKDAEVDGGLLQWEIAYSFAYTS